MTNYVFQQNSPAGPRVASGAYAETLGDLAVAANKFSRLVEAEKSGIFDGLGADFWLNEDVLLLAAREIVRLVEARISLIPRPE